MHDIETLIAENVSINFDTEAKARIESSRKYVTTAPETKVIYGINTGFGPMAHTYINPEKQHKLQYNLIRSHACGLGSPIDQNAVRIMMFIRLHSLAQGYSGVSKSVLDTLKAFIEHNITPVVPEHGSVGASGDLVQLAHIALALIGEGSVFYKGEKKHVVSVLNELGLPPATLTGRDGLALINGTASMTAIATLNILQFKKLIDTSLTSAALLYEIAEVNTENINDIVSFVRPHTGQRMIIQSLQELLRDSKRTRLKNNQKTPTVNGDTAPLSTAPQEIYSLRCVPQILGPIQDTLLNATAIVEVEMNAVTDNPIITNEHAYHNGNFHGDYISLEMDKCRIALSKLSILLDRQINFIANPRQNSSLPPFVNRGAVGLDLALQAAQFVSTSTTAENQTLATPIYTHSITTNNDNQDVVSMGTNSALLTSKVLENTFQIQAVLSVFLAQAVDLLDIENDLSTQLRKTHKSIRSVFPPLLEDRYFADELAEVVAMLQQGSK